MDHRTMTNSIGDNENKDHLDNASEPEGNANVDLQDSRSNQHIGAAQDSIDSAGSLVHDKVENSQLLEEATAAVLQAAGNTKQADGTLSATDGESDKTVESDKVQPTALEGRSSALYMEEASIEASLVSPNHHRLHPSGQANRPSKVIDLRLSSNSNRSSSNSNGLASDESDEISQAGDDTETDFFHVSLSRELEGTSQAPEAIASNTGSDDIVQGEDEDLARILESHGLQIPDQRPGYSEGAVLLHALFDGFCTPSLDIDSVERIIDMERGKSTDSIHLPVDVVIQKPKTALFQLLGPPLFKLPRHVSMSLFRILLRLLTNDSDKDYNYEILASCPWLEEKETTSSDGVDETIPIRDRTSSVTSLHDPSSILDHSFYRDNEGQIANRLYTIVRFRRNWKAPVSQILSLIETMQQNSQHAHLTAPAIRLLGLLCTAGVLVDELRRILALTTSSKSSPAMQVLLVRALKTAAAGASRSSLLAGKASPRSFFSFASGPGITRTISLDKSPWPFRNDFGMALWFRAERFSSSSTLLRATDQASNGIEISIVPLEEKTSDSPPATVLAISILQDGKVVKCVQVQTCILHPRVWYHVAVRHRRSGLKGVFSLSSREQISVILDGKLMLTEALKFPVIQEPLKSLRLKFGSNFDGQTGSLYVFHDNVSEATFRSLYETTAGTVHKIQSAPGEWDSRRGDIVKKSRVLDLNMRRDDVDDIVLSQRSGHKETSSVSMVVDLDDEEENSPLSKTAFNSRLFIVWDPRRTENDVALELHAGAHARIDQDNVQPWTVEGAQDVIGSIGGVQALLPVFRSLLSGNIEHEWESSPKEETTDISMLLPRAVLCSIVPDLLLLLAAFIRDHHENAREMLRCGGIDIVEQLLQKNRKASKGKSCLPANSLISSTAIFPRLSRLLVKSILELHYSCSHYVGLETKVFSRVLYNMSLWFGGSDHGISLYATLLPVLSSTTTKNPEKVRDCVGVRDMMSCIKKLIEVENDETNLSQDTMMFHRECDDMSNIHMTLSTNERRHAIDVYLGMVFQILAVGANVDGFSQFLHMLSYYLEFEWGAASQEQEMSHGAEGIQRSGIRKERYIFTRKACTLLLFLLQITPSVPGLYESFAATCGSVQDGAAWILSAIVNSFCDEIRSIGMRILVTYVERTSRSPDLPLALEKPVTIQSDKPNRTLDGRASIHENTMSLISNVGQGLLNTNVGKGLAAIGPSVRSRLLSQSKLTARVVYKLLWHLLKSHRHRMGMWTQAGLTSMVFIREKESKKLSFDSLKEDFIVADEVLGPRVRVLDMLWAKSVLEDSSVNQKISIRNILGLSTLMRLLRFLPDHLTDQWLTNLYDLSSQSQDTLQALSLCPDWQPSLFQFISELVESIAGLEKVEQRDGDQNKVGAISSSSAQLQLSNLENRLHVSLELYSSLLGHRLREGGDQASTAIEDAASLQRVCLNGQEVFSLILSGFFANLSKFGVVPIDQSLSVPDESGSDGPSFRLKRSARLVTDSISSNGAQGMAMPAAVGCWRCLRHLTAVTVAVVSRLGFGVADLFDYRNQVASAIDEVSGGLHGIRLREGRVDGISSKELCQFYRMSASSSVLDVSDTSAESMRERGLFRRICVAISAQILSLLDVFIFPDSLDASLPASQLHGLALVRSTETRIGSSQGPLLTSLVRLSLLLLCHLEPCSVKLLQCSSRLRCFLHWIFELIREAEALEGYSAAFNKLTAPFDRLILAIVLQCHRTLGRCASLLREIESTPFEIYFDSKEAQKKAYRRLLRVSLELRDILVAIFERRNEVLKTSLSSEAFEALRSCLEVTPPTTQETGATPPSQKEVLVRNLLFSTWVAKFQDVDIRGRVSLPEQLQAPALSSTDQIGISAIEDLLNESDEIVRSFEKSLNVCFEKYLEAQRKWAETGAVRDLECDGDSTMKRLSQRHSHDLEEFVRVTSARNFAADERWKGIDRKTSELWKEWKHWKLAKYTDRLGRRILLVRNRQFDDHAVASYDLQMGMEREKEERGREERLRKKQQRVSEVMKRNVDAFKPQNFDVADDDEEKEIDEIEADSDMEQLDTASVGLEDGYRERLGTSLTSDTELDTTLKTFDADANENIDLTEPIQGVDTDIDAWAKSFIWTDNESVVARFDSVMIVTLQHLVEGNLLLTTHGIYFHETSDGKNVITKESEKKSSSEEANDRRWRLSRLTEVHGRRYMLRSQALELFFSGSHELFLNFANGSKERDRFYAKLRNSCRVPMLFSPKSLNPRSIFKKSKLTELWRKRKISNFEYLMALNRMAGRTFNDIAQYPVLPWILSDYTSEKIDLSDSRFYRDLSKPVGALNPDRLSQLLERYSQLEQFGFAENEKFLYGSHYSSPGVILHYMIRQEPFTSMAIDLQSGRFDCPDRLFFDIAESWKSCNTSSSDVKELIPEFFTLPEMFINTNSFPLGTTQRGKRIDNVELPPWAKGSAYEFVKIHRLALESEYVSKNLHHWVDLVFGYQQRGLEAEKANNVFHHLSYEGSVDLDKITDELDRQAAESHIENFGQTPSQLIAKEPHPARLSAGNCWAPLINNMSTTVKLRCQTPSRQFGGKKGGCGSVAKIQVHADSITVIYSDLKVGTFKWNPKNFHGRLTCDKLKSLPNRQMSNSRSVIKRGSAAPQTMDGSGSKLAVGNWSFAITVGGYEKEQLRRKAVMTSRLASAKDALYTDAASLIVSCGYWDNTLKVHSTDSWRLERSDSGGHRGAIRCLSVGQDGGLLVTGGEDCTCRVWVVDHPDMAIALSDGYVQTALGQTTDGDQVISCCHVLWGHDTPVTCLDLSSDLDVVVSGSLGGRICVHTLRRGEFVRSIFLSPNVGASVDKIAVDNHGRMVVHSAEKLHTYMINGVELCSTDAGERIHDMKISGEVLVTGGDRCHVYIRDLTSLKILSGLDLSRHGPIRCISLTPDELNPLPQHLFIGSDDGMISIVDREEVE